jgi:hypothetical protein
MIIAQISERLFWEAPFWTTNARVPEISRRLLGIVLGGMT